MVLLNAQEAVPGLEKIIPPSPTSASLGKYADVPVSLYTGVPDITVPIWNCQGNSLQVPVSLSYDASGLKVKEIAGWVGTGWTLNAGGLITRSVRGMADDLPSGFLDLGHLYLSGTEDDPASLHQWSPPGQLAADKYEFLQQVSSGKIDLEPDIFYFNFSGKTGKFVFSTSGDVVFVPAADLKIRFTRNQATGAIEKWVITDEHGVRYTFGGEAANEITTPLTEGGSPQQSFVSAWHLTDMDSPNGEDHFSFSYRSYESVFRYPVPLKKQGCKDPSREDLFRYSQTDIAGKYLQRIDYARGSIVFEPETMGAFSGGEITALKRIKVIYPPPESRIYKVFNLDYSFFPSTGCGTEQDYLPPCRRLRLDQITESSGDGSLEKPPWQFYYDQQPLPPRGSFSIDYWGYYNGKHNDQPVPALRVVNYPDRATMPPVLNEEYRTNFERLVQRNLSIENLEHNVWDLPGADRNPDSLAMQAGILKRMVYPTGGSTQFEYEPHTFGYYTMPAVPEENITIASNPKTADASSEIHLQSDQQVSLVPLFYNFQENRKSGGLFGNLDVDIPTGIPIDNGNPSPECRVSIFSLDSLHNEIPVFDITYAVMLDTVAGVDAAFRFWLASGDYRVRVHAPNPGDSVIARFFYDTTDTGDHVYPVYGNDYQKVTIRVGMDHFINDSSYAEAKRFAFTVEDDPVVSLKYAFHSKLHPNRISTTGFEYPLTFVSVVRLPQREVVFTKSYCEYERDSLSWNNLTQEWFTHGSETLLLEPGSYEVAFIPRISTEYGLLELDYKKAVASHDFVMAGGLRIKRIIDMDHARDTIGIREYRYAMDNSHPDRSSGVLVQFPQYDEVLTPLYYYPKDDPRIHYCCIPVTVYSKGRGVLGKTAGRHIGYAKVSEYQPGNGHTAYEYTSPLDVADITSVDFPFVPAISNDWQRGMLKQKRVFTESGEERRKEEIEYHLPGYKHDSLFYHLVPAVKVVTKVPRYVNTNVYATYVTQSGWSFPVKKTTEDFGLGESVPFHREETYKYSLGNMMINDVETLQSDGSNIQQKKVYAVDQGANTPAIDSLQQRHMDDVILETATYRDSIRTEGERYYYGLYHEGMMVLKDSVQTFAGDTFFTQWVFDRYDEQGHILQMHRPGGIYQSFQWSPNGFPVTFINHSVYYDQLSDYPEEASITRYTYNVHEGITSITDPNDRKITYSYDPLGRLETVRDPDDRIMKQLNYHYQRYEGDTTRPYYQSEDIIWSTAPTGIACADTPVIHNCSVTMSVIGGSLGTGAGWYWYTDGCGVHPVGTGNEIILTPQHNEKVFVRGEGPGNITGCREVGIRVLEPAFTLAKDTLWVPPDGTPSHPVPYMPGYSGCDPWYAESLETWFTLTRDSPDNLTVLAEANLTGNLRTGIISLFSANSSLQTIVAQKPVPELVISLSWTPTLIHREDQVTFTVTTEGGEAPYDYTWERKDEGSSVWSLIDKHLQQEAASDQIIVGAGDGNFDIRCRVTSGGQTVEKTVPIIVAQ